MHPPRPACGERAGVRGRGKANDPRKNPPRPACGERSGVRGKENSHGKMPHPAHSVGLMLAKLTSATVHGVEAIEVAIEVHAALGIKKTVIVGLPDAAVKESGERVQSALSNCGFHFQPAIPRQPRPR